MSAQDPESREELLSEHAAVGEAIYDFASKEVARRALDAVPCVCDQDYFDRGMVDPKCVHHDLTDALEGIIRCGCGKDTECTRRSITTTCCAAGFKSSGLGLSGKLLVMH